ncbi:NAD-dependent epimerase/dehydratase family protein [Microbacterium mcarthurae (nom. nud.)]|uniref:NAD-dependent epimerase/dehydratase family protein n=1 Tax=Microbacterium mcarthurae TaxID=3035918 RepID=A0ABW9GBJ0_9MICO
MRIAIAGATGTIGRHVHAVAAARGHDVVSISRAAGHDLTRDDLVEALTGVDGVIDVVSISTLSRGRATSFFETTCGGSSAMERLPAYGTSWRCPSSASMAWTPATTERSSRTNAR